jgi:hypothetical protein
MVIVVKPSGGRGLDPVTLREKEDEMKKVNERSNHAIV